VVCLLNFLLAQQDFSKYTHSGKGKENTTNQKEGTENEWNERRNAKFDGNAPTGGGYGKYFTQGECRSPREEFGSSISTAARVNP
jgi:hypothetical protein